MLLAVASAAGAAETGGPTLRTPPPGGPLAPTGRIEIHVPPDISVERLARWTLELDGIDVTALVAREGELAVFTPPQPLESGVHELRIVETTPAGALDELARWRIRVRPSVDQRLRARGSAELTGAGLIAENNTGDPPGRFTGQGSGFAGLEAGGEGWRLSAEADGVVDTRQRLTPNGNVADLDEFRFAGTAYADVGAATLEAGHSRAEVTSMVMGRTYNRRGLAATFTDPEESIRLRPFMVRTERIAGVRHGLGIADPDNRTIGGTAVVRPLDRPEALSLEAALLTGQGRGAGIGQASPLSVTTGGLPTDDDGEGTAGSLRAGSTLLDGRLAVAGEFAATDFDPDAGGLAESHRSHGYRVDVGWSSRPRGTPGDGGPSWGVDLSHERRGLFFASPADPLGAQDFRETVIAGRVTWPSVQTALTLSRLTDNVEDVDFLPTIRSRGARGDVFWTPALDDPTGDAGLLGRPSLRFSAEIYEDKQIETPRTYIADKVNRVEQAAEVGASFLYPRWSWDLSHRIAYARDSAVIGNRLMNFTQLSATVPAGRRVLLSPYVQLNFDDNRTTGVLQEGLNAGLSATATLIPGRLRWSLNYAYDASAATDDSVDFDIHTVETTLDLTVLEPEGARPGVTVSLRGAYNHSDELGTSFAEGHSYEVFGVLSVGLQGEG